MTTSEPRRIRVQGADVTGISLSLAPLASIDGRVVFESDPKNACAKRRATAPQETVIIARRISQTKPEHKERTQQSVDVPLLFANLLRESLPDAKGGFNLMNLQKGSYRIEPRPPSSGWYIRSIVFGPAESSSVKSSNSVARDGITLKSGERVSGLTVTLTEGAASLRGSISVAEGQKLPPNLHVYLVPAERDSAENVVRFFEARADGDGSFGIGNIAPGRYWVIARAEDESDPATMKPIRQDSAFRSQVLKEAEKTRNEIPFQPCQRMVDYDLHYPPTLSETKPKQ